MSIKSYPAGHHPAGNGQKVITPLERSARRVVLGYANPVDSRHLVQKIMPLDVPALPRHAGRPRTRPVSTGRQRGRPAGRK